MQRAVAPAGERSGPQEKPAAAAQADRVAQVVAEDRCGGGNGDHRPESKLPGAGEHARR